ncbi:HAMP domain-containing protein [Ancylobacter dichloromethanicus]
MDDAAAVQLGMLIDLAERTQEAVNEGPYGRISSAPAGGPRVEPATEGINAALGRRGRALQIVVTEPPDVGWPTISARLSDGRWLIVPLAVPKPRPEDSWGLIGWILLVALGVTLVMIFAVRRLTEPLALLQRTADAITPCSDVDPVPEKGPAEVRAAARAINQLATRLRQVMESRMRLVAAAGHDLRTPMTRMRLRAEFFYPGKIERPSLMTSTNWTGSPTAPSASCARRWRAIAANSCVSTPWWPTRRRSFARSATG